MPRRGLCHAEIISVQDDGPSGNWLVFLTGPNWCMVVGWSVKVRKEGTGNALVLSGAGTGIAWKGVRWRQQFLGHLRRGSRAL